MSQRAAAVAVCVFCLALGVMATVRAQDDLGLFTDTVEVHVVNIEVMVTDADGRPVSGLTREDFQVFEDGEPVELTNFFAVEGRKVVVGPGAEAGEAVTALGQTPQTQRLHLVVFIDNLNTRPEHRNLILDDLRRYLRTRLDPRDRVMLVVLEERVRVAEPFTNDSEQVLATLGELEKQVGPHVRSAVDYQMLMRHLQQASLARPPQGDLESPMAHQTAIAEAKKLARDVRTVAEERLRRVRQSGAALESFVDSLAGLRGRKALLYVSDGMPVAPAESLVEAWLGKYETWILDNNIRELRQDFNDLNFLRNGLEFDAAGELDELVAQASASGVAFYPISLGGQTTRGYLAADNLGSSTGGGPGSLGVASLETLSKESSLLRLADGTGGVAFTRSANITGLLEQVEQDFQAFYSLGYSPPRSPDNDYHEVEVKLKDKPKGVEVRYLKQVQKKDPLARLQDLTLSALLYDLDDNPLGVILEPGEQAAKGKNRYRVSVMVKVPFANLLLLPQGDSHAGRLSIFVVAGDDKGRVSPFQRIEIPIQIPNDQILQAASGIAGYPMQLDMREGRQRIAVGVRDQLARIDSTVCVDLSVGDENRQAALTDQAPGPSLPEN